MGKRDEKRRLLKMNKARSKERDKTGSFGFRNGAKNRTDKKQAHSKVHGKAGRLPVMSA